MSKSGSTQRSQKYCQSKLAWDGQGTFVASPNDKTFPISSQIYKVVQKVVLRLGFAGVKPILYNNYKYLILICGAQKRTPNFLYFGLITDTYFSSKI